MPSLLWRGSIGRPIPCSQPTETPWLDRCARVCWNRPRSGIGRVEVSGQRVAVVGATGAVGREILQVLEQRGFPLGELRLFASPRSVGDTIVFQGARLPL